MTDVKYGFLTEANEFKYPKYKAIIVYTGSLS